VGSDGLHDKVVPSDVQRVSVSVPDVEGRAFDIHDETGDPWGVVLPVRHLHGSDIPAPVWAIASGDETVVILGKHLGEFVAVREGNEKDRPTVPVGCPDGLAKGFDGHCSMGVN